MPASAQPFLKWAGGKRQLLAELSSRLPTGFATYYEPFLGGGALLLSLAPDRAVANDANSELVRCFAVVRDDPERLLTQLAWHTNAEDHFYAVRARDPAQLSDVAAAARFVFLNRTCFNGLYRVNRKGQFNTPYGRYERPNLVPADLIRAASQALQGVELMAGDYRASVAGAGPGDFVYLDPPYLPVSRYGDFRRYGAVQFRDEHHVELARMFKELDSRGCSVMLSNSSTPDVLDLYADWRVEVVHARRAINSRGDRRGRVAEVVVRNY